MMKKIIKNIMIGLLDPIVSKLGYASKINPSVANQKNSLLHTLFTNLSAMGFTPKHIIDVGANHGTWTRETIKYFPQAQFTLLEPQKEMQSSFQDLLDAHPKMSYHAVGAGSAPGSFKFTIVNRDDSCSFRYTEEQAKQMGYRQIEVPVVTLNDLVQQNSLPVPDIIKIDAEGLDLEVLKGASSFFGKTEVFMVEASVMNPDFDNNFLKVLQFMDDNGYRLFEITDLNRPFLPKVLWLVELAFIRKNGIVDSFVIEQKL